MEPTDEKQQIGYLLAKIEEICSSQNSLNRRFDELEKRVDDKFRTAEIVFSIGKFLGLSLLAILTFKLGDIGSLWTRFFGS